MGLLYLYLLLMLPDEGARKGAESVRNLEGEKKLDMSQEIAYGSSELIIA
jgi:hypothetical protein